MLDALRGRKSIRGFTGRPVARQTILEILTDAAWAPSSSNQQPWHFHVVAAGELERLCENIRLARLERSSSYDPSRAGAIPQLYVERTRRLFKQIRPFIASLPGDNKSFIEAGSFRFYGAPTVIFLSLEKCLPKARYLDIGMAAENLMLSAHCRGLGTCAIALTLYYADAIQESLDIDAGRYETLLSVALGYPDEGCAVNLFRSGREDIDSCVTWRGL